MIIFDENLEPIIFDSVLAPTDVDLFYVLDLEQIDFMVTHLLTLEETISPAFHVQINDFIFYLPTSYHILVYSEETSQVDTVKIHELTNTEFSIFSYDNETDRVKPVHMKLLDYIPSYKFTSPMLNKNQMLCHPIAPNQWINITAFDQYKMINGLLIGDFEL